MSYTTLANICGILMVACGGAMFAEAASDHPCMIPFIIGFVGYGILMVIFAEKAKS